MSYRKYYKEKSFLIVYIHFVKSILDSHFNFHSFFVCKKMEYFYSQDNSRWKYLNSDGLIEKIEMKLLALKTINENPQYKLSIQYDNGAKKHKKERRRNSH